MLKKVAEACRACFIKIKFGGGDNPGQNLM